MISVLPVDGQVILATTVLMPSIMSVMNLAILPRTGASSLHCHSAKGCPCHDNNRHSHTCHFSHRHHSHHSTDQSSSHSSSSCQTAQDSQPRKIKQSQDPQPPINPTIPKQSPSKIFLQNLHQILTVTLIL